MTWLVKSLIHSLRVIVSFLSYKGSMENPLLVRVCGGGWKLMVSSLSLLLLTKAAADIGRERGFWVFCVTITVKQIDT